MNEEQEHANFSLRNTLYTNFESLLECICVEGILEVTQAQNAVNWGIAGEQVSMIILLPDKIYPNTCRFILFLPALKPLAAQSFLHTRHVHTIATSTRGPLITIFSVFVITFVPMNVIVFKVWVCSNRIITEGVQALTLPGLITMKKAVLHHFAGLQDLREDEKYIHLIEYLSSLYWYLASKYLYLASKYCYLASKYLYLASKYNYLASKYWYLASKYQYLALKYW